MDRIDKIRLFIKNFMSFKLIYSFAGLNPVAVRFENGDTVHCN